MPHARIGRSRQIVVIRFPQNDGGIAKHAT